MVERRSFLKGLAASLVVPSPTLWTPEERQIVAETDMPPPPAPVFEPANPQPPAGFMMVVMPDRSQHELGSGWNGQWVAYHARPDWIEVNPVYPDVDTFCSPAALAPNDWRVEANVNEMVWHTGPTSAAAARQATEGYTQHFGDTA